MTRCRGRLAEVVTGQRSVFALLAAAAAALVVSTGAAIAGDTGGGPEVSRDFELTYGATVSGLPSGTHRVEVWLPYPVSDGHQSATVERIAAPGPYEVVTEPRFGNSMLHLAWSGAGRQELTVEMQVRVARREFARLDLDLDRGAAPPAARAAREMAPTAPMAPMAPPMAPMAMAPDIAKWLQPDRLVPLDAQVRQLAAEVTRGRQGDLAKARAIYDYVVATMAYDKSGTGWGNGDIHWACDAKRGNCTDFHALFIGLARAVGIPARFEIGLPLPAARGAGEVAGYHCWAEFYLPGLGWVPVDASEARKDPARRDYFFGAIDENRVQLSIGRDLVLSPKQAGPPLNFFVYPYVEIDGHPFAKVERRLRYRDAAAQALPAAAGRGAR